VTHRDQLDELATAGRLRALTPRAGIDFSSNDYLGLANSPRLREAVLDALLGGVAIGSGGSRLLRGNDPEHERLEAEAAAFFGCESALYMSSGFSANETLFATLPQRGDLVVHDALIHASAHEGLRCGRAERAAAHHNDVDAFADAIRTWRAGGGTGRAWIAVESLYAMDGDRAPLDALAALADAHDAMLVIDEAHAVGVFGPDGRGLAAHLDGRENVIVLRTCGKALGVEGALLCLPRVLRDFLVNRGRGFIFSTAPSPLMARAVGEALRICADEPERREALQARVRLAEAVLGEAGVPASGSQIIPVILGEDARAMRVAGMLQDAGYDVRGIRPPTVPAGTSRLRVSVTLNASEDQIRGLGEALQAAMRAA
jgi:8-amino-7-oxononanoate synthase